jgi:hypothetical protein
MIEKTNISIQDKLTKKINYYLNLDSGYWRKSEFETGGNQIYYEDTTGYWSKGEYNDEGKRIYSETSDGYISDDRKTKH